MGKKEKKEKEKKEKEEKKEEKEEEKEEKKEKKKSTWADQSNVVQEVLADLKTQLQNFF